VYGEVTRRSDAILSLRKIQHQFFKKSVAMPVAKKFSSAAAIKQAGAAMMVAKNLIKFHPYYRGLSAFWGKQKVDPRDRHCRIANRAMRIWSISSSVEAVTIALAILIFRVRRYRMASLDTNHTQGNERA